MAPSKTWMRLVDERLNDEYLEGVENFLDYAFSHVGRENEIRCPCIKCCNTYSHSRELVSAHLKVYGILRNYTFWYHHGEVAREPQTVSEGEGDEEMQAESADGYDPMQDLLHDLFPQNNNRTEQTMTPPSNEEEPNNEAAKFYKLLDNYNHVKKLWINWRGDLHRHFVKPNKTMQEAVKKVPKDIPKDDWEWLVKEHFFSKEFLKKSKRNTQNRANLKMLHRSGSKPFRQIIWDMGGKENNPPSMDKLFSETHKKGTSFADSTTSAKHAQIKTIVQLNPGLSNDEVMQKCDTSKRRDRVVGFGGGIRARDLRGPALSKAELVSKLQASEQEKKVLEEKFNGMVQEVSEIKRLLSGRSPIDSSDRERQDDQD